MILTVQSTLQNKNLVLTLMRQKQDRARDYIILVIFAI